MGSEADGKEAEHSTNISRHNTNEKTVLPAKTMKANAISVSVQFAKLVQSIFTSEGDKKWPGGTTPCSADWHRGKEEALLPTEERLDMRWNPNHVPWPTSPLTDS